MVDRSVAVRNPYPGLRPFRTDEEHLFFGRESQVDRMIDKLAARRFLSVVGTSGSGKSSLVNCGLRPALHRGYMAGAGAAWRMAQFRPGGDPIGELARALAAPGVLFDKSLTGALTTEALVEATLRLGSLGLVDIVDQADLPPATQLLVVADQFEELFRFRALAQTNATDAYRPSEDAVAFVSLLLEASACPQVPIHIVLTMRSDFLGDCSQFQDLPEAINEGQYLVPRLTRNEIRAAITGPAAVAGATLGPVLVTRLLNDVGDNPDQLSILQHALNRTWARWQSDAGGGGQGPVDLPHYEAIGTMAQALDQHAERAYAELDARFKLTRESMDLLRHEGVPEALLAKLNRLKDKEVETEESFLEELKKILSQDEVNNYRERILKHADTASSRQQQICKKLFQALTDKVTDPRGVRRPTTLGTLCALADATPAEVTAVIEVFRKPSRSFLMPPAGEALDGNKPIDISHESLMRVWKRLNTWADEEARSAETYRLLANAAIRHAAGKASLWRDPDLQLALDWRETSRPNETWAKRLGGGYETAIQFLDQSHRANETEKAEKEAARRRDLEQAQALAEAQRLRAEERTRAAGVFKRLAVTLAFLVVATVLLAGWAWRQKGRAYSGELAAQALAKLDVDPQQSVELALEGATRSWGVLPVPKATDALRQALFESHVRLILNGHTGAVTRAVFSPDGRLIASASEDHTVRLWDAASGGQVEVLVGHSAAVNEVEFSPDGRLLVTAGLDGRTIVWETNLAKPFKTLMPVDTNMPSNVRSATFSPDGKLVVAASEDGLARIWDYQTGAVRDLAGHSNKVFQAVFSPDGQTVLTASEDGTARIWDARTGQRPVVLTTLGHSRSVVNAAFGPGGLLVATASSDGTAGIWWANGIKVDSIQHDKRVETARFSPFGDAVVTASLDGTARVWRSSNHSTVALLGHVGPLLDASFSPDNGHVVTAGADKTARLWTTDGTLVATFRGHGGQVNSARFSPSGQFIVTASDDHSVRVWEAPGWHQASLIIPEVSTAEISPDAQRIAPADEDGHVQLWPVQLWPAGSGRSLIQIPDTRDPDTRNVSTLAFSRDSRWLVTASESEGVPVQVWNVETSTLEKSFTKDGGVRDAAFSPDNRLIAIATAGSRGAALLWDWNSDDVPTALLTGGTNSITHVAFSPDGRYLLTVAALETSVEAWSQVQLWRVKDQTKVAALAEPLGKVQAVAFHPEGGRVVIASLDGKLRLWDWQRDTVRLLDGHESSVNCVRFSPDGRFIVSASSDKTMRIWAADTGTCLATLRGHTDFVKSAGFSPNGRTVVSVARNGRVIAWATEECVPQADLLTLAAQRLRRAGVP